MADLRGLIVSALFHAGRTADRAARATQYMAGGALRLRDVRDGIRTGWQDHYRRDEGERTGLMAWERDLADRFIPAGAAVLVVGCGSGRDAVAFAERGCRVSGIDPSSRALETARRTLAARGLAATLVEGFFEDAPMAALSGPFDAVVFSYYTYSCLPEGRRRVAALARARALVEPGGHVIVSHADHSGPHLVLVKLARLVGALSRSDWRVEPGDRVWDNRGPGPSYSYSHAFLPGEVEREAAAAGLRVVFSRETDEGRAVVLAGA